MLGKSPISHMNNRQTVGMGALKETLNLTLHIHGQCEQEAQPTACGALCSSASRTARSLSCLMHAMCLHATRAFRVQEIKSPGSPEELPL